MKFDFSIEINDALATQTVSAAERTAKAYFAVKAESLKQSGEIQQSQVAQDGFAYLANLLSPIIKTAAVKVQQTEGSNSLLPLLLSFIMPKPQPQPREDEPTPQPEPETTAPADDSKTE
jgi:hypothetical protein